MQDRRKLTAHSFMTHAWMPSGPGALPGLHLLSCWHNSSEQLVMAKKEFRSSAKEEGCVIVDGLGFESYPVSVLTLIVSLVFMVLNSRYSFSLYWSLALWI